MSDNNSAPGDIVFFTQTKLSGRTFRAFVEFEIIKDGKTAVKLQLPPEQLEQLATQFQRAAMNAVAQEAFWQMMTYAKFEPSEAGRLLAMFRSFWEKVEEKMDGEIGRTTAEWMTEEGDPREKEDDDDEEEG